MKIKNLMIPLLVVALALIGCGVFFLIPQPSGYGNSNTNKPVNLGTPAPTTTIGINNTNGPNSTPKPTPPTTPASSEKKDEGIFSFPPPQAVSVARIDNLKLLDASGPASFGKVSEKLVAGLERAGYTSDHYSYFWNSSDEFAIVTGLERVNEDGSRIENDDRWNNTKQLPRARSVRDYFRYLISGKKVYYRVLAFIITSKNYNFKGNSPPSFEMASEWMNKGMPVLGTPDDPGSVQNSMFTERYHCFALLYLFVNHTSLDGPLAVNSLPDNEVYLLSGLNKGAESHLAASGIVFGE